jgi:hypothetical protein
MNFQSNCWVNLRMLGQAGAFYLQARREAGANDQLGARRLLRRRQPWGESAILKVLIFI